MAESTLWSLGDSERPPWRRALRTVLLAATLTPLLLFNASNVGWDGSIVDLAPVLTAGAAFGLVAAATVASAEANDWSRGTC